jgi:hypothetical protein
MYYLSTDFVHIQSVGHNLKDSHYIIMFITVT